MHDRQAYSICKLYKPREEKTRRQLKEIVAIVTCYPSQVEIHKRNACEFLSLTPSDRGNKCNSAFLHWNSLLIKVDLCPLIDFDNNCCPLCMKAYNKIYYINSIHDIGINTSKRWFETHDAISLLFWFDVTVRLLKHECPTRQGPTESQMYSKYLSWIGTNPVFTGCTRNFI